MVFTDAVDGALEEALDVVVVECVEDAVNDTVDAVEHVSDVSVEGSAEGVTGECW